MSRYNLRQVTTGLSVLKICVLGAGVIGTTTAYFLQKGGHEVTVIDRQSGAGLETSFANGGQISVSHAAPWAGPQVPILMLKWLGKEDAPLLYHLRADPALWRWSIQFLMNCRTAKSRENTVKSLKLALYSRQLLLAIREDTGIEYDLKTLGILDIHRNAKTYGKAVTNAAMLNELGCTNKMLGQKSVFELEPALKETGSDILGGVHTPDDESGDAHAFTRKLAIICANRGVTFRYNETVSLLEKEAGRISSVVTDKRRYKADAYVVSIASYTPKLLRPLGLKLPIYPAKGYSVTIPVGGRNNAPQISVSDEDHRIVYTRLGERLRVAGTAEFDGFNTRLNKKRGNAILEMARSQFPNAGDFDNSTLWTGLRPLTPDGLPAIGRTPMDNLYLNTGHGTLGWTLCAGSGKAAADLVTGNIPDIDLSGFAPDRF